MNKTIALAAIVMVAVVMGMSAFAPSVLADPGEDTLTICHYTQGNGNVKAMIRTVSVASSADHLADHTGDFLITNADPEIEAALRAACV